MQAALLFFALLTCCGACVPGQKGGVSRAAYSRGKGEQKNEGGGEKFRYILLRLGIYSRLFGLGRSC